MVHFGEGTLFCLNSLLILLKSVDFELFLVNHDLGSKFDFGKVDFLFKFFGKS